MEHELESLHVSKAEEVGSAPLKLVRGLIFRISSLHPAKLPLESLMLVGQVRRLLLPSTLHLTIDYRR